MFCLPFLEVESLSIEYLTPRGSIRAVDNVSFSLEKGEVLGIGGESGSGKSTLGLSLIRLTPFPGRISEGNIRIDGIDILTLVEQEMCSIRGKKIAYVFQDPQTSLNPIKKIGAHFVDSARAHDPRVNKETALKQAKDVLKIMGVSPERINDYPHQLSGGMCQRIMIALGIALTPGLLIADEPTTALDVIVQAKILDLLESLRSAHNMALIIITHDLSIILGRCHKVAVMYAGQFVEYAECKDLYKNPYHPYTQGLLQTIPTIKATTQRLEAIPGSPPDLHNLPRGCHFGPRCRYAMDRCLITEPPVIEAKEGHLVRCFLLG